MPNDLQGLDAILKLLLAGALGVVAWFLKGTASELREVRRMADAHEVQIARHDERLDYLEEGRGSK